MSYPPDYQMVMMGVLTKTPPPPHSPLANPQFAPTYYIALFTATIIFLQRLKPLDILAKVCQNPLL